MANERAGPFVIFYLIEYKNPDRYFFDIERGSAFYIESKNLNIDPCPHGMRIRKREEKL